MNNGAKETERKSYMSWIKSHTSSNRYGILEAKEKKNGKIEMSNSDKSDWDKLISTTTTTTTDWNKLVSTTTTTTTDWDKLISTTTTTTTTTRTQIPRVIYIIKNHHCYNQQHLCTTFFILSVNYHLKLFSV